MAHVIRVTGAWTSLLGDWLDHDQLPADELRALLDHWRQQEVVPIPVWQALLQKAVALRPAMVAPALQIGALVQPRHVGVLGYLVLASKTLGEAMLAYQRYERLFYGVELAEIGMLGDQAEIRWRPGETVLGPLHDALAIAALVTFLRRQIENPPPPTLIAFTGPSPTTVAEQSAFETFFGCKVQFGDTHTRVRFPVAYLAMAMPHSDPGLRSLLDRQAQALLLALPDSDAFDRALQQTMLRLLPDASATLPRVAQALHVSVRTLQRRLDARGLSWQQLLDRTREQLAKQYLADRALTLSDIALLLGFSEQSAFTRAFRRWSGTTPAQTRRNLL